MDAQEHIIRLDERLDRHKEKLMQLEADHKEKFLRLEDDLKTTDNTVRNLASVVNKILWIFFTLGVLIIAAQIGLLEAIKKVFVIAG